MRDESIGRWRRIAHHGVRGCAACVAILSTCVLTGWLLNSPRMTAFLPGRVAMNPATAVAFALSALSLWMLYWRPVNRWAHCVGFAAAGLVVAIGAVRVAGYCWGFAPGIDTWLFRAKLDGNVMAPNTAVGFVVLGIALGVGRSPGRWGAGIAQGAAVLTGIASLISLIGYLFGVQAFYEVESFIPMALNTALAFHLLSIGLLLAHADSGLLSVVTHHGAGGVMARLQILIGITVPLALGAVLQSGLEAGWYDTQVRLALMVAGSILLLLGATWYAARSLNWSDDARRWAFAEIEQRAAEIQELYNSAPCGYHSLDADDRIVAINDTELVWLGFRREEIIGRRSCAELAAPASRAALHASLLRCRETGVVADFECDLLRKDGSRFPGLIYAKAILDEAGGYLGCRMTVCDASERRRANEATHQAHLRLEQRVAERTAELAFANRELAEKNRDNEMFVYSVSHDLRAPLVNLQGYSNELSIVLDELTALLDQQQLPEEVRRRGKDLIQNDAALSIRFIQKSVLRLSGIIDVLLRLSRVGRVEYRSQPVDLDAVVLNILESSANVISEKKAQVTTRPLPKVLGDAQALDQLFGNLVDNALKYADPQRPLTIEIGLADDLGPSDDHPRRCRVVYVKDNGLGIPPSARDSVFRALQRAHPDVAPGEGIGLAIVQRIAERLGGRVWLESSEHQGTTFFVALLAAGKDPTVSPPAPPMPELVTPTLTEVTHVD